MDDFDCPVNLDPEVICRICLESKPLTNLFVKEIIDGNLVTLPTVFQQFFRIKIVHNDKLPQKICIECKKKLIESIKFKRKCESSNKVLHDLLEPGYDYTFYEVLPKPEKTSTNDFSCQTDDEITAKFDENVNEDAFEDGIQYSKIQEKVEKAFGDIGDEFDELYNLYSCFDRDADGNFCVIPGCYERLSTAQVLQSHMRTKHSKILSDFIQNLDLMLQKSEEKEAEPMQIYTEEPSQSSQEPFSLPENTELIQIAEIDDDDDQFIEEEITEDAKKDSDSEEDKIVEITNVAYHCPICHKLYQGPEDIEKHRILHEIVLPVLFDNTEFYCCEVCKAVFVSYDQIKNHLKNGHEILDPKKSGNDREFQTLPAISKKIFLFKDQSELDETGYLEMFETFELKNDSPLICGVCQKSYKNIESVKYHSFSHTKNFDCPLRDCETSFDFFYKLLGHIRYSHYKEKIIELTCPYCKEQFKTKKEYGTHVRDSCKKRVLSCNICSKKFVNQAALKNHLKVHDEQKCEECGETYLSPSDLRNHIRMDHADNNKMYKCNYCPKRFRTPSHRTDHENTHNTENKYQCDICQNFFKSERVMKSHQKLHTVGRSHACPICGKMFNRNYHVKLHMKTHKEKPV
ncbi:zinc finger protein 62-like [Culicoides brevitarsis]|uniref:zinc finger protein 62-like n=1 Tax=Culicoides brevitarsis TaxID=469753 RepID=UPI00307BAF49